jgi:hypothetical protein
MAGADTSMAAGEEEESSAPVDCPLIFQAVGRQDESIDNLRKMSPEEDNM